MSAALSYFNPISRCSLAATSLKPKAQLKTHFFCFFFLKGREHLLGCLDGELHVLLSVGQAGEASLVL